MGTEAPFDDGFALHAPVGSFRPKAFGLHDVHGNVQEWCADPYTDHLAVVPERDPTDPGVGRVPWRFVRVPGELRA